MTRTLSEWAELLGVDEATVTAGLADSRMKYDHLGGGVYRIRWFYRWRLWRIVRAL